MAVLRPPRRNRHAGRTVAAAATLMALMLLLGGATLPATALHEPPEASIKGESDALGRAVPAGMAGPVHATGELGPLPARTPWDVRFETVDVTSDYAVESYKLDHALATRTSDDLENLTTNWDTALGHHIRFTVEVDDGRSVLDCDDTFVAVAYIETTHGPLYGWTNGTYRTQLPGGPDDICQSGLPGVRVYEVVFDLDGSPPTATGTEFPALLSGFYIARLELYHHEPTPTDPSGTGPLAGVHEIAFALQDPRLRLDPPLYRFPEGMLRMISDTGGHATHTHQFAMPARPLTSDQTWELTIDLGGVTPSSEYRRIDHYATRMVPGAGLGADPSGAVGGTPLDPLVDKFWDQFDRELLGVEIHRNTHALGNVPASGESLMELRAADFDRRSDLLAQTEYTPLNVLTIHVPASLSTFTTGAESIVVPTSDRNYPVRGLDLDDDLPLDMTRLLLQDSQRLVGGPLGADAGDLFALRPVGTGHETITRAVLEREPESQWVTGEFLHMPFADVPRYRLAALLHGPADEFLGMRILERGIDVEATSARYVEGRTGSVTLTISHLPMAFDGGDVGDGIEARIAVRGDNLPDGQTFTRNVTLAPGQATQLEVTLIGSTPGVYTGRYTATNGEVTKQTEAPIEVVSLERAAAEDRRWYQIPGFEAVAAAFALLAAALVMHRRRDG